MRIPLSAIFILTATFSFASELKIDNIEWSRNGKEYYKVKFTVSWNNSWRNDRNYDAAWLFIKYTSPSYRAAPYQHAKILRNGCRSIKTLQPAAPDPVFEISEDRTGFFVYPYSKYRGNVGWSIEVSLDTSILNERNFNVNDRFLEVFGIEMVHIPTGSFTIGEADTVAAWKNYSLFVSDGSGRPGGLWKINGEKESISIGKEKGKLFYNSEVGIYQGDQKGIIPTTFPKGFQAFYIMKYETTQGQYAAFLNCISNAATGARANFGGRDYYFNRGSIRFENGKYIAGSPGRPCNYFSWDDACAYADWAALRPMTELEFEKASRGPRQPVAHEFPWNTGSKDNLQRMVNSYDELVWLNGLKEGELNDSNRDHFGASYYWVMDLAGSLWERCVTIGDSTGRNFSGTHGDGMLAPYGFASNADWPKGSTESTGFGFKGGGYYEHNMAYGEFNPHAPIGYRNFGSWAGGARSLAYGSRFVRSQ